MSLRQTEVVEILEKLHAATVRRRIEWQVMSDQQYQCKTEGFLYTIWPLDDDGAHPFVFDVARVGSPEAVIFETKSGQGNSIMDDRISTLYEAASRSATGADQLVEDVMSDLDDLLKPGPDEAPF